MFINQGMKNRYIGSIKKLVEQTSRSQLRSTVADTADFHRWCIAYMRNLAFFEFQS